MDSPQGGIHFARVLTPKWAKPGLEFPRGFPACQKPHEIFRSVSHITLGRRNPGYRVRTENAFTKALRICFP
jgi:hypothetical protein